MRSTIGRREVNQQLAKHIKAVEEGHDVIITRRGRARLTEDFQHGRTLERVTFVNPFTPDGLPEEVERALDGGR